MLLESRLVREILGAEVWLPIPRAREELPGVLAWRGRAVPVVDLGPILGSPALAPRQSRARTLIVEHEGSFVALPVDEAREVRRVPEEAVRSTHAAPLRYAHAEIDADGVVMPLLDLSALLRDLDERADHGADGGH